MPDTNGFSTEQKGLVTEALRAGADMNYIWARFPTETTNKQSIYYYISKYGNRIPKTDVAGDMEQVIQVGSHSKEIEVKLKKKSIIVLMTETEFLNTYDGDRNKAGMELERRALLEVSRSIEETAWKSVTDTSQYTNVVDLGQTSSTHAEYLAPGPSTNQVDADSNPVNVVRRIRRKFPGSLMGGIIPVRNIEELEENKILQGLSSQQSNSGFLVEGMTPLESQIASALGFNPSDLLVNKDKYNTAKVGEKDKYERFYKESTATGNIMVLFNTMNRVNGDRGPTGFKTLIFTGGDYGAQGYRTLLEEYRMGEAGRNLRLQVDMMVVTYLESADEIVLVKNLRSTL